jgi:RNA polymerase sigma-70 factor, ECF subfamily
MVHSSRSFAVQGFSQQISPEQNGVCWNMECGRELVKDSAAVPSLAIAALTRPSQEKASALEGEVVALFDEYRGPLLRYVLGFGLTADDSEEIIQETFLSLFQHLREEKSRANLRGWLFRVAHNMALKRRYRIQRSPEATGQNGAGVASAVDPAPTPEDQVLSGETHRRLRAVVEVLPEMDRKCLFLRADGLRYREIAEILSISLGAVSLSLSRSLARIARAHQR